MTNRAFSRTLNNGRLNINIDLSLMCSRKNGTVLSPVFLCRLYTLKKDWNSQLACIRRNNGYSELSVSEPSTSGRNSTFNLTELFSLTEIFGRL